MKSKRMTKDFVWTRNMISPYTKGTRPTLQALKLLTMSLAALLISGLASGDIRTVNAQTPVIQAVDGGRFHSLALENNGRVWAWGVNTGGKIGDNTNTRRPTPVKVHGVNNVGLLSGVTAVSAGGDHSLALKSDGTVFAWGSNGSGQLGDGTTTARLTPIHVQSLTGIIAIAAGGGHSLALKSDGTVFAWGSNRNGQLGDGTIISKTTPIPVHGVNNVGFLFGVVGLAAGADHSLALKSDGTVLAWGNNSSNAGGAGQLGDGTATTRLTPVQVHGVNNVGFLTGVTAISAGGGALTIGQAHSLALKSDGAVFAWGWNRSGPLGDGTIANRLTPIQVHGVDNVGSLSGVTALAAGSAWSLAAKSDGTAFAWGVNTDAQLGDGTRTSRHTPVQSHGVDNVGFLTGVMAVAAGEVHSLALTNDGSVFVWGQDGGAGDLKTTPVQIQFRADNAPPEIGPCFNSPPGLKGRWPLDETTGTTAADIIGGHNGKALPGPIGALTGSGPVTSASWPPPPFLPGKVNSSLFFEGNRRVEVPHNSVLEPGTGDFTVDAWVFYAAVGNGRLLTVAQKNTGATAQFGNTVDGWRFVIRDSSSTQGLVFFIGALGLGGSVGEPITPNTWHHVAATLSTTSGFRIVKIYVDGVSLSQVGLNGNITSTAPLLIGGDGIGGGPIAVDEVEIFNRALTQQEIQAIFNAGSAGKCKCVTPPSGMVAWWPGDGNADDIQDGNNGTISRGMTFVSGKVGQAFNFDGSTSVQIRSSASLLPREQITVDGWIKPFFSGRPFQAADADIIIEKFDNLARGYVLSIAMDPTSSRFFEVPPGGVPLGTPAFFLNVAGIRNQIFGPSPIPNDGSFHFVAGTYDGTMMRLFLDGIEVASRPVTGSIEHAGTAEISIGRENVVPRNSKAAIDEVEIFDRALTQQEIQAIFKAGSAGKCKTVVSSNKPPLANAGPDQTVEATSASGASVILNGSGSSDPDSNPLTYNWTGPFGTVSAVSHTVALPLGTHTVTLTVNDGQATATDTVKITVRDTTPPDTNINSAVDGNGAAVSGGGSTLSGSITLTVGGTDAVGVAGFQCSRDGSVYAACYSPVGYSALAIGSHTFQVRALDAAGNVDASPASFTWTVITPAQAIENLITTINNMGLAGGVATSLIAPLNNINTNNPAAACAKLNAFINQVNTKLKNGQLTSAQGSQLLQAANAIKADLGC